MWSHMKYFFWPKVLSDIRHLTKSTDKRCRAEYISGSFKSGVGVILFFFSCSQKKREPRREGQRQTVKVREEKFVCSFFPLSHLTTLISSALSLSLCRRLSASFLSLSSLSLWSNFTTERVPGGDSHTWFSLNYLPSVSHSANSRPVPLCFMRWVFSFFVLIIPLSEPQHNCWFKSCMNNANLVSVRSAGKYCVRCSLTTSVSNRAPAEMWTRIDSSYLTWKWS